MMESKDAYEVSIPTAVDLVNKLIISFLNLDTEHRSLFLKLLIIKLEDDEVDLVLQMGNIRVPKNIHDDMSDIPPEGELELTPKDEPHELVVKTEFEDVPYYSMESNIVDSNYEEGLRVEDGIDRQGNSDDIDNKGNILKNELFPSTESTTVGFIHEKVRYPCDQCDYTTTQKGKIKMHVDTIHNGKVFPCEYDDCQYTSLRKDGLKNHISKVHGHEKVALLPNLRENFRFNCKKCDYSAKLKEKLKLHIDAIHDGKQFSCDYNADCTYQARRKEQIKEHIMTVHENIRYPCDKCEYTATQRGQIKFHVETVHEGKGYKCKEINCKYIALKKDTLEEHIRKVHINEKVRFYCDQCDFTSTVKAKIKLHIDSKHEGIVYACEECDYKASRKDILKVHVNKKHNPHFI